MVKNLNEGPLSAGSSSNASQVTDIESPDYIYHDVTTGNFCSSAHEKVLLASVSNRPWDNVAIRIRYGPSGYTEWLTELQVYLLPNFKHKNILEFYNDEESQDDEKSKFSKLGKYVRFLDKNDPRAVETIEVASLPKYDTRTSAPPLEPPDVDEMDPEVSESKPHKPATRTIGPFRAEYWLMTRFSDSMTLRDFLIGNTLTWAQMIKITKGIMRGLYFLHENNEYQNFDTDGTIDSFIGETNGAIRRVAFKDVYHVIHMKPHFNLAIIHRNLCSKNIVLKRDFTPCIWNFGNAYIHHPFQPTNHRQLIDPETKRMHLLSHYSAPEVLQEKGHLSMAAMKSIDMYASGIIMWELISRCVLPRLEYASELERREREIPDNYFEPLEREIGPYKDDHKFTDHVVCKKRIRPRLKLGWLVGKKTYRYVQTMKDLWDPDFDARLHPATVIGRMRRLSLSDRDRRNKYFSPLDEPFDSKDVDWPDEQAQSGFQAPLPTKCGPNKIFDDYSEMPAHKTPGWITSDSDEQVELDEAPIDRSHSQPMLLTYELLRARKEMAQANARRKQVRFKPLASSTPKEYYQDLGHITTTTVENSFEMISLSKTDNK